MRNAFLVLSLLIGLHASCQEELAVPENKSTQIFLSNLEDKLEKFNLEDLRKDNENRLRIWAQNKVLTFGETARLTLYASKGGDIISETYTLDNEYNFDSLHHEISIPQILKNKDERRKIDEFPLTIEIITEGEYQLVSIYGNKALEEFITAFDKRYEVNKFHDRFINELPRGNYRMGMSMISVDRLFKDSEEKSEFYKEVIWDAEHKLQLDEDTTVTEFPLVLINEEPGNLRSLNALDVAKVENYKILPGTAATNAIYGNKGKNGVILVNTK